MSNSAKREFGTVATRPAQYVAGLVAIVGVALLPPVFERLLAMAPLDAGSRIALWVAAAFLLLLSLALAKRKVRPSPELLLLFGALLLITGVELAGRLVIVVVRPDMKPGMAGLAAKTRPEFAAYRGHPFAQFSGNPGLALRGNENLGGLIPFNNYGFLGEDFTPRKDRGVVRIAALGGSTTASGYPLLLEEYLGAEVASPDTTFEALNFGHGWYTTAHSTVNFVLTAVDLSPDYVVIHHGWNDRVARDAEGLFRGDYSHALKSFESPVIIDRVPIRLSVVYRYLKEVLTGEPDWAFLGPTLMVPREDPEQYYLDLEELAPFERNVRTIVDLARLRGITPVLTTQPFSRDPDIEFAGTALQMAQTNDVIRRLATEYDSAALFVDLDSLMVPEMSHVFRDVGHVTLEGRRYKARAIGQSILRHLRDRPR